MSGLKKTNQVLAIIVVILALALGISVGKQRGWLKSSTSDSQQSSTNIAARQYISEPIPLPAPSTKSLTSVEAAMQSRRSRRSFTEQPLTLQQLSQILWSLQGQTADWGGRTVPSAKSAYPLEITLVAKNVDGLEPGVYHYVSPDNALQQVISGVPTQFDEAAVQQAGQTAPAVFYISADFNRMTEAFEGEPHDDNVLLEAGHAGQNVYLQVESLGLGTVVMGGFNPALMSTVLQIPSSERLIYQVPVGNPSEL